MNVEAITEFESSVERTAKAPFAPVICSASGRTHLDLFSGIGGFALAARMTGWQTIGFSEINEYASKVLKKYWPNVPNFGDVRNVSAALGLNPVLVTGGFPCQPFSIAGKRLGEGDDRYLWPEVVRILRELRPRWALLENVPGILTIDGGRTFQRCLGDLAEVGFDVLWNCIPACAIGASHRRERVWIVAHTNGGDGAAERASEADESISIPVLNGSDWNIEHGGSTRILWNMPYAGIVRAFDGIPRRVDRMRGLGNAIVPQVAAVLLREMALMTPNEKAHL